MHKGSPAVQEGLHFKAMEMCAPQKATKACLVAINIVEVKCSINVG